MSVYNVSAEDVKNALVKRKADTHKGDYGRVLIISGSLKYVGAPFFAAQAAVRSGSGLVFLAHPDEIHAILASKLNEVIFLPQNGCEGGQLSISCAQEIADNLNGYDAILAGPGLGRGAGCMRLTKLLLMKSSVPVVLDADCLNALSEDVNLLKRASAPVIITPHEGEFKRLCPEFSSDKRAECALRFAQKYGCITVLKGHETVTALPDGRVYLNSTGNPGMAKGGSGDVLAGIITSLLGQGIAPEKAAYIGVWLHGRAGDMCCKDIGEYGMTPTDMLSYIPKAILDTAQS